MGKARNLIRRRPAETSTFAAGSLSAALVSAGIPARFVPLILIIVGAVPGVVSWCVDRWRSE